MLLKLCAKCQRVIQAPNRYCKECQKEVEQQIENNKKRNMNRYNKNRNKKYKSFYNSQAWKLLRDTYKEKNYLCEECQAEARRDSKYTIQLTEEVHHKEPIQTPTGWLRRLEWSNLIALCHYHHDMKHNRFKKKSYINNNYVNEQKRVGVHKKVLKS